MPFCNKCGTEVPENTNFCPKCGGQQGGGSIVATGEKTAKINKIILAVTCGLGVLAVFLPLISAPLKSVNWLDTEAGWELLILCVFSLTGACKIKESSKKYLIESIICLVSGIFGVIRLYAIFTVQRSLEEQMCLLCSWGVGLYLAYISSIATLIMSILMILDNLKRGKK